MHLDASRTEAGSAHEIEVRWATAADELRASGAPPELVAAVEERDHTGAEITVVNAGGRDTVHEVEGGHDELHKVRGGGLSHRRLQSRVEDSWERNAAAVAEDLDRVVAAHHPAMVVLGGDPSPAACCGRR